MRFGVSAAMMMAGVTGAGLALAFDPLRAAPAPHGGWALAALAVGAVLGSWAVSAGIRWALGRPEAADEEEGGEGGERADSRD